MRPDWDSYFMKIAYAVSERSTCDRAFVGCVSGAGETHPDNRLQWLTDRSAAL